MKNKLVEVIHVYRDQNIVYVALHSPAPYTEECSNQSLTLSVIEEYIGFTLPDGRIDPIIMFYWDGDYGPTYKD